MDVRTQRKVDNYIGRLGIAALRPAAMVLGTLLRRDHRLTVGKEVVWIKLLGGGSLLIAMPMLLGFRRAHPNVKMVLITTPAVKPFAELMGVFDEYRIIDNRGVGRLLVSALVSLLRTMRADCIIDLEVHSRLSTVFTTLTLARNRVSFWLEDIFWRRGLASHLVFFNRGSGSYHFYDRIGEAFGTPIATRDECRTVLLTASGAARRAAPLQHQVCIGFACSDLGQERMLTPEQWHHVFQTNLRPQHRAFRFLGGPGDRERAQAIIETLTLHWPGLEFANECGTRTLAESIALLYESAEFWGIDSGLLHFARILDTRCVSYWGPTDPATRLRMDWAVDEKVHYVKIACSPCVHTSEEPPCRGDNRCIQSLFATGNAAPRSGHLHWTPMEYPPERPAYGTVLRRGLSAVWRNIGFVCVAITLMYCVVHAFDPPRLNWGDPGSDYNVMSSGANFARYGFIKLRLTPFLMDPALIGPADRSMVYTHYPQLADLMNGVLRVAFGLSDLVQFRLVALAFSFCALFFVYRLIALYWSREAAQVGLALWVLNPIWLQFADYLHYAPYTAFFGFGSVYFLTRYLRAAHRRRLLFVSGAFLFFAYLSAYDAWFFIPILLALVAVGHYRAVGIRTIRTLASLALFAIAAVAFKAATNIWALGGVRPFLEDIRFQLLERATGSIVHTQLSNGIWPTTYGRIERCFSLLLIAAMVFWALVPVFRAKWMRALPGLARRHVNPYVLLIAALPFLALFTELWVSQYAPTLLVLPFYTVACAALIALLLEAPPRWARPIGLALAVALFANSIAEDLSFSRSFFTRDSIQTLDAKLQAMTMPGQYVMTNHLFDFLYMHYFRHATIDLIMNPPQRFQAALAYYADASRTRVAPPSGAIFVQHKHVADQLYDKNLYYLLAREGLWWAWGNPERYHDAIERLVGERDSLLTAAVASVGQKVYETEDYAIWRIPPQSSRSAAMSAGTSGADATKHESHLAEVQR